MSANQTTEPGDVIEFFENKRIITGMCLSHKNSKLHVITETSRIMNVAPNRVLHVSPKRFPAETSKGDAIQLLRNLSRTRAAIAQEIDLAILWTQLDAGGSALSLSDLTELAFPAPSTIDQQAGLVRKITGHRAYFSLQDNVVLIQSEEQVKSQLHQLELTQARESEKSNLTAWLKNRIAKNNPAPPLGHERLIAALKAVAINAQDQPDRTWLRDIIKPVSGSTPRDAFNLLVKLEVFSPNENLDLLRFDFPIKFSQTALDELHDASVEVMETGTEGRLDLRFLDSFTIDNESTLDMDDALSIEISADGSMEVGIHITDASEYIPCGSILDQEAAERAQTLYLPETTHPMFPEAFCEYQASLVPGEDRLTLSTLIKFSPGLEILDVRIAPAMINVKQKLSYENAAQRLPGKYFTALSKLACHLREQRVENGAILMPRPELSFHVTKENSIIRHLRHREDPTQVIVAEMMILANRLAAEHAAESQVPFPYRSQKAPNETAPVSFDSFNPYVAYRQRRMMPRAEVSITPQPHYSLGVSAYTNITSPLRRYFDIIAQRQLKYILKKKECYSREDLSSLLTELDVNYSRSAQIITNRNRYWLLKYMQRLKGESLGAVVLERFPHRCQIWLTEYVMDADIPPVYGKKLYPEDQITVIVEKVSPRDNILKLRLKE